MRTIGCTSLSFLASSLEGEGRIGFFDLWSDDPVLDMLTHRNLSMVKLQISKREISFLYFITLSIRVNSKFHRLKKRLFNLPHFDIPYYGVQIHNIDYLSILIPRYLER